MWRVLALVRLPCRAWRGRQSSRAGRRPRCSRRHTSGMPHRSLADGLPRIGRPSSPPVPPAGLSRGCVSPPPRGGFAAFRVLHLHRYGFASCGAGWRPTCLPISRTSADRASPANGQAGSASTTATRSARRSKSDGPARWRVPYRLKRRMVSFLQSFQLVRVVLAGLAGLILIPQSRNSLILLTKVGVGRVWVPTCHHADSYAARESASGWGCCAAVVAVCLVLLFCLFSL